MAGSAVSTAVIMGVIGLTSSRILDNVTPPMPGDPAVVTTNHEMVANIAAPIHRKLLLAIQPNVTFTCDIGTGGYDGVNLYEGRQQGSLALLAQFGVTNVFPVSLDTNWPHFIAVRTFINWPMPGVVQTFTNDDGSVTQATNTFYENTNAVAGFLWVPAGMTNQWLAQLTNGQMELIGWGLQGATYAISNGTLHGDWKNYAGVTGTNGPWTVPVEGTNPPEFFKTTRTGP